jgi:hypothetical protein
MDSSTIENKGDLSVDAAACIREIFSMKEVVGCYKDSVLTIKDDVKGYREDVNGAMLTTIILLALLFGIIVHIYYLLSQIVHGIDAPSSDEDETPDVNTTPPWDKVHVH